MASATLNPGNANDLQVVEDAEFDKLKQPRPYSDDEHHVFMHGVASGDPLPTSVVLWTRVTPTKECSPGSGRGEPVEVTWEIAEDKTFSRGVRRGVVRTGSDRDFTVHVDPFELAPDTAYYYRFRCLGEISPVGATRTVRSQVAQNGGDSASGAGDERLRFAVTSCANYESGFFGAYGDIARRAEAGELDMVIHMGDYIYEYATGEAPGKHGVVRPHVPTWTLTSLADYRSRYGNYRRDVELQAAHAALPWVVTWDDHEIANDAYAHGAEEHNVHVHGPWKRRQSAGMQAYFEWLPIRATNPSQGGHLYRSLSFGNLVDLHMLDLRTYRNAPGTMDFKRNDSSRTIMGSEQFEWLSTKLETSGARWNLVGTSVMVANLNVLAMEDKYRNPVAKLIGENVPFNADQWDGFTHDRNRLLRQIKESGKRTIFVTGDIHSEWAIDVRYTDEHVAAELVTTSVSAPNVDEFVNLPENNAVSTKAERHIRNANPHVKHLDLDAHGYAVLDVSWEHADFTWYRVADVEKAGSPVGSVRTMRYDGARITSR